MAHTHAAYSFGYLNERFSYPDKYLAKEGYGLDIYVATPRGKIKKYSHQTDETIVIYGETWHDRQTKEFFGLIEHSCDKCAN